MRSFDRTLKYRSNRAFALAAMLVLLLGLPAQAGAVDSNSLIRTGYQQICHGNNEQAIETLSAALRVDPNSVYARRYLAYALLQSGLAVQAATQFEAVGKLSPETSSDLALLGDAYFYSGQYHKALKSYHRALSMDAALDQARTGLVHTYVALGDTTHATSICHQALQQTKAASAHKQYVELLRDITESQKAPEFRTE
jgi:Flp pilus assembly protein TadD